MLCGSLLSADVPVYLGASDPMGAIVTGTRVCIVSELREVSLGVLRTVSGAEDPVWLIGYTDIKVDPL